ncbi:MAG: DUF87 domain-containing protein [Desulfurococcales archaeon]|jgi:hypothetical protein|nr:DUF87 domain-containing protein [Desulfurococcales archaeon]
MSIEKDVDITKLDEILGEAEKVAIENGRLIGRVSRVSKVSIGEEEGLRIDVPFINYIQNPPRKGSFVCIAAPATRSIIFSRVIDVERIDLLGIAGIPSISIERDPRSLTTPASLIVEPLSERSFDGGEILPHTSPIDPQSPVFIPKDEIIIEMLGLKRSGIKIGYLFEAGKPRESVPIRLDEEILRHHVLVIGTTGSGKTTLLSKIFLESSRAIAFDIQGDYLRVALKHKAKDTILIMPLTRGIIEELCPSSLWCQNYDKFYTEKIPQILAVRRNLKDLHVIGLDKNLGGIKMEIMGSELTLIPMALEFSRIYGEIPKIIPLLSIQASLFFPRIISECLSSEIKSFSEDFQKLLKCAQDKSNNMRLHKGTVDNIMRVLRILYDTGLLDVKKPFLNNPIPEPDYETIFSNTSKIIIDLGIVQDYSSRLGPAIITYRILSKIFEYSDKLYKRGDHSLQNNPIILILDEAHEFFPRGSREDFEKEIIEEMINRIMRLGRVRGLSCVMATHRPQDLNDLVIELANTKIAFRSDRETLKRIDMEEYSEMLESAPPGLGVIKTFAYKVLDLEFRTEPV